MAKKKTLKFFRKLANQMPKEFIISTYFSSISGADLILSGQKLVDGQPINPKGNYRMKMPSTVQVNHESRLKTAFSKGGVEEVFKYCARLLKPESHEVFKQVLKRELA
jgi:hypothetical protein